MRENSKFQAKGAARSIYRNNQVELSSEVKASVAISGVERVLKITGPDFRARLVLPNDEAVRIGKLLSRPMNMKSRKTGEQVVFFPRKKAVVE